VRSSLPIAVRRELRPSVTDEYRDRWIICTDSEVVIRAYYFPWGTKHVPYASIREVRRIDMGVLTGRSRIWGTANPRYWASLDPARRTKRAALVLDLGRLVKPFITPDDVDAVDSIIERHTGRSSSAGNASMM
jgi:hypothetical protein